MINVGNIGCDFVDGALFKNSNPNNPCDSCSPKKTA